MVISLLGSRVSVYQSITLWVIGTLHLPSVDIIVSCLETYSEWIYIYPVYYVICRVYVYELYLMGSTVVVILLYMCFNSSWPLIYN